MDSSDDVDRSLGIRRGTVQLAEHSAAWTSAYDSVATKISAGTGIPVGRIQHVGSTSVPGLAAKPILDIVLGLVIAESVDDVARRLVDLGYIDRGSGRGSIGRLVVWETAPEVRTVHVHIVEYGSMAWRDYVEFRDELRRNSHLRERYSGLKRLLAERFCDDRKSYRHSKGTFIRDTLDTLRSEPSDPSE